MAENPFDACWDRLERLNEHRVELARIWNEYIDRHPFDFALDHEGDGVHLVKVWQTEPMPRAFSVEMGEWLYNARTCLDYIIWATCAYTTGHLPPPDEETLQYPIYESLKAWKNNEARLKHLLPHHREMLWTMQPFNSDLDANYLGVINRLARIDRHRRLTISTGYLAEVEPVFEVPAGCSTELQWGQRVLVNGTATVARVTVTPWRESASVRMNPRIGIDPEIVEWADSTFWRPIRFSKRLGVIQSFLQAEVACYEYDCTGFTRQPEALTDSYRAECDARGPLGSPSPTPSPDIEWGPPQPGHLSTVERFEGSSFPSGPASVDVDRDGE